MPERLVARQTRLGEREARTAIVQDVDQAIRSRDRHVRPVAPPRPRRASRPRDADVESASVLGCSNVGDVVAHHDAVLDGDAKLIGDRDQGAGVGLRCIAVRARNQRVMGYAECVEQTLRIPARALGENPDLVAHAFDRSGRPAACTSESAFEYSLASSRRSASSRHRPAFRSSRSVLVSSNVSSRSKMTAAIAGGFSYTELSARPRATSNGRSRNNLGNKLSVIERYPETANPMNPGLLAPQIPA